MVQNLNLNGFTNFSESDFTFSKINVFIGKNGTGKTHILKSIAATIDANNSFENLHSQAKERFEAIIAEKLTGYFKPEHLGRLVKRQQGRANAIIDIKIRNKNIRYSFAVNSKTNVKLENNENIPVIRSLYIPPREMFSLYEGFLFTYEKRELSFDETYFMLAKSLDAKTLKGARLENVKILAEPLEKELDIKVLKENGRFYIQDKQGKFEAHLVAEGIRKLSSIMYLITNGELDKNTILFWDEPESNLNPSLIKIVANFIISLAEQGVQLFIATHDYLLTHLLSLRAEYRNIEPAPEMKFFSLQENDEQLTIEQADTLPQINNNPILDEYAAYFDLEQEFAQKMIDAKIKK
ncbi:MAG: AAA family ATPase [Prevotellaceae bacterium]|jgi:predicted ATPase|nr:AAA family ATPase [Prevotellaceae bacterium]